MRALDKKLVRDFRRLWAQALAIALVLACGVAILLTTYGMYGALDDTRTAYYERNRLADVWADANRAPRALMEDILAIDGVRAADARVSQFVVLDVPGRVETVIGHLLSLSDNLETRLNLPLLRQGRLPDPTRTGEVAINAPFAKANDLQPGDTFLANLNGQKRELTVTGTVLSPEFIYTIGPGALLPDNHSFGILWIPERAAAAAFDMEGAFNNLSLRLDPLASEDKVIKQLDHLLDPYGGTGAYGRDMQQSNAFIDSEIEQLRASAAILPPIFYGISAFLVAMVISRIIALERTEIGLLKAVGYSDWEVCFHYLLLSGLIAVLGVLMGWTLGSWLSQVLARFYANFFDFPYLIYRVSYDTYVISGILALLAAGIGAARSALSAARIAPAEAMSPPAPPRFKRSLVDRAMTAMRLSQPVMMILRSLMRWPGRSALSVLGLSLAAAVLIASSFFLSSLDVIMDTTFGQSNRQDASIMFTPEVPETALAAVANLPGVLAAEGQQFQPAILRNGHVEKSVAIDARRPGTDLSRIIDRAGRVVTAPPDGIMLSQRLAETLAVRPGDVIEAEFKGGRNETHFLRVSGVVTQYIGLGAYMDQVTLNRLLRQAPRITGANMLVDSAELPALHHALKQTPELSGLTLLGDMRQSFTDTVNASIAVMTTIYVVIAVLITFGVTYNGARIQLSERARELASLRILGFTRGEVSFILVGETMILAVLAQPLGWLLGAGISALLAEASSNDLFTLPLVLEPSGYARASLIVLAAALGSSLVVRRRLDHLDLVQVMKTRE